MESLRWDGTLLALFDILRREAYAARGGWVGRVLPSGAIVRMRVDANDSFRREIQVAHRKPTDLWPQIRGEIVRAAASGSISGLNDGVEKQVKGGGLVTTYRELFYGEVRPGLGVCACGAPVPFNPQVKPICPDCKRRDRQEGVA